MVAPFFFFRGLGTLEADAEIVGLGVFEDLGLADVGV